MDDLAYYFITIKENICIFVCSTVACVAYVPSEIALPYMETV